LYNARRLEESENDFAAGGYVEEIGTNRRLTPKENTENSRAWSVAFPDSRGTITSRVIEGNKVAAEVVWRGTNRGSLMGNPPTGKTVEVRAVVMLETDGAKIARVSHYIDVAGMMAQLGAAVS
jgi:steroid delta-isomerase-like uncharacterized protein